MWTIHVQAIHMHQPEMFHTSVSKKSLHQQRYEENRSAIL